MVGQTISHYRIVEKLGEGGMGVVYKAEDTRLKRSVALKFLPHGLETHEPERARFLQEAQAASALNHPNVCTIYDIGDADGLQFIAMEYVDGKTLSQLLPLRPIQAAVSCAIQIGEALEAAHSKGIIHRDIKPANIMLRQTGHAKVMDFGLAKLKGTLKLTRTSSTVGTLAFMAPEQIEGKETDGRSDIFSFGVVLYEMITGHLPFRGEHEAAMMYSIVNEEPESLQTVLPDAPSELLHVLNRALEKDPEDRYQTVHDMVIDLRRLKKESTRVVRMPEQKSEPASGPIPPPTAPRPGRWKKTLIPAAGAILIVCVGVAILLRSHAPQLNPEMKFRVLQLPFRNVHYGSMSEDGKWIVFPAADDRGKFDVYMMNMAEGQPRRVTQDSCYDVFNAALSPDASTILYSRRFAPRTVTEIVSIPSLGGKGRVLVPEGHSQTWMPDGSRFGYHTSDELRGGWLVQRWWSCKPDGSDRRVEIVDTVVYSTGIRLAYEYSPDGMSIAWTKNFPGGHTEIMIRDREAGTDRQLTHDGKFADDPLWSPTGHIIYSSNRGGNINLWMLPEAGGEPVQITRGSGPDVPLGMTPDGRRLMYSEAQDIGQVRLASLSGGSTRQLTVDDRQRGLSAVSPSGRYVAFPAQEVDAVSTTRNIYVMDRDGGNVRKLTDDALNKSGPYWSPDEKWITYGAQPGNEPDDSSQVYLIQADNPGQPKPMGRGGFAPWFSDREFALWRFSGTSTRAIDRPEEVTLSGDSLMAFPVLNGTYIVALDWHVGREGWLISPLATWNASGATGATRLTKGVSFAVFPPGTRDMYYVPLGSRELHRVSLPDGKDRPVNKFPGLGIYFSIGTQTGEIAYTETYRKMRFVLIENVFK